MKEYKFEVTLYADSDDEATGMIHYLILTLPRKWDGTEERFASATEIKPE
jgi:hypothetical protein